MKVILRHHGPGIHPNGSPQKTHDSYKGTGELYTATPRSVVEQSGRVPVKYIDGRQGFMRRDELEADQFLGAEFRNSYKQLTESQVNALNFYRSDGYAEINALLRGAPQSALTRLTDLPRREEAIRGYITNLDQAMTHELSEDTEVWRGVSERALGNSGPGDTIIDRGFVSTSLLKHIARDFVDTASLEAHRDKAALEAHVEDSVLCRIVVKKGTKCMCTCEPSTGVIISKEVEILLSRNQRFLIKEIVDIPGGRVVHLETVESI